MLGLAPLPPADPAKPAAPSQPTVAAEGAHEEEPSVTADTPHADPAKARHKTMLGLAFNLPAPVPVPIDEAKRTLLGPGEFVPPSPNPAAVPFVDAAKGTLIGVAVPGIAPINPGVTKPSAQDPSDSAPPSAAAAPEAPAPLVAPDVKKPRASSRALLWALTALAIALGLVSLAGILRWKASPKLDVKVESDENGNDALLINCSNCDDGTRFSLEGVNNIIRNHRVRIPLRTPLKMGQNGVSMSVIRGSSRPEIMQLRVPVDFRVTGDTSGLADTPPKLRLRIEKTPAVQFQVDHTPVVFDAMGRGVFEYDISNDLIGPAPQERVLEKRLSYQVREPSGSYEGGLTLKAVVTPLVVTSPGSVLVTEGQDLKICGRTDARARVEIAGLQTRVDGGGQFCNAAVIREFGQFEVWITAKRDAAAPRRVKLSIERTSDLKQYAKTLYPRLAHEVPVERSPESGSPSNLIAITGVVVEQSKAADATRILLKYDSVNGPKFARINSFASSAIKTGARITVFGEPLRTLQGPDGHPMGELSSAFEVPALH